MQFFAGICTHMFQKCSVIHKSFVLCRSFDDALVLFRAALVEDTNTTGDDSIGNGRVDVAPTAGSEKDAVIGKEEASITDDGEVSESCMEWNFATAQMESVTHVKYPLRRKARKKTSRSNASRLTVRTTTTKTTGSALFCPA